MCRRFVVPVLALALAFLASTPGHARPRLGLEAGVNVATLDYERELPLWDVDWRPMFTGGLTLHLPFGDRFGLTTGLRYVQEGHEVELRYAEAEIGVFRFTLHYLTVPAWLELQPTRAPIRIVAGPEVGMLVHAVSRSEFDLVFFPDDARREDIRSELDPANLTIVGGVLAEFPVSGRTGTIALRYVHGLLGVAEEDEWYSDWTTRGIELTLGTRW